MRIYDSNGNLQYSDILGELSFGKYVRNITIDNSSNSSSLTDYQILITVDTATLISAGKMRSDCGDIRFYDGTNNLSYWIESGINTTSTRIWVKVPSIPASGTKIIQMYYGNPNLGSLSSGDKTFLFFDDFSGGLDWTNKWKSTQQSLYTISNGALILATTSDSSKMLQTKNSFSNFEVRFVMQEVTKQLYAHFPVGSTYQEQDTIIQGYSTNSDMVYNIGGTTFGPISITPGVWYYHRVIIYGTNTQTMRITTYTDSGWTNVLFDKIGTSNLGASRYPSFFAFYSDNSGCKMDFIYIKNYSSPEPTITIGNEYTIPIRIK